MLKKKIAYKDYLGNERTRTLYFHISTTVATRMVMSEATLNVEEVEGEDPKVSDVRDGLAARIRGVAERGNGREMLDLFDWLVQHAYGEIEDDGESFNQSQEVYDKWRKSASYDAFFSELVNDTGKMTEFVNKVFSEELRINQENLDPEFKRHREAMDSR